MIILEAAVYGAIELHCVVLTCVCPILIKATIVLQTLIEQFLNSVPMGHKHHLSRFWCPKVKGQDLNDIHKYNSGLVNLILQYKLVGISSYYHKHFVQ